MKKIIYTIILFISITCKGQHNTINTNELTINNINVFGITGSVLIQNFGQPNLIKQEFFEIENKNADVYVYVGVLFYLLDNTVDSFEISNVNIDSFDIPKNKYLFTTHKIKIGDNIKILQTIYPLSFANKKTENNIFMDIYGTDRYIRIHSDSNDLITEISMNSY